MNAEHEVRTALLGIAAFVETSAFNQSQPMKLDSTCILTWLIHTMFIVVVMDAETQNVETKGMSSLNVSACFRYLQRFSHVICSFWLSFKMFQDVSTVSSLAWPFLKTHICSACIAARRCAMGKLPQRRLARNPVSESKWWQNRQIWKILKVLFFTLYRCL